MSSDSSEKDHEANQEAWIRSKVQGLYKAGEYRPVVSPVIYRGQGDQLSFLIVQSRFNHRVWGFPQGGIEPDETIDRAMDRELEEELKISSRDDLTDIWHGIHYGVLPAEKARVDKRGFSKGKGYFFSIARYIGDGRISADPDEVSGTAWVPPDDCPVYFRMGRPEKAEISLQALGAAMKMRRPIDINKELYETLRRYQEVSHAIKSAAGAVAIDAEATRRLALEGLSRLLVPGARIRVTYQGIDEIVDDVETEITIGSGPMDYSFSRQSGMLYKNTACHSEDGEVYRQSVQRIIGALEGGDRGSQGRACGLSFNDACDNFSRLGKMLGLADGLLWREIDLSREDCVLRMISLPPDL